MRSWAHFLTTGHHVVMRDWPLLLALPNDLTLVLPVVLFVLKAAAPATAVARVLADGVVVAVVNHTQFPHHVTSDRGLYRPVVCVVRSLNFAFEPFHVDDLGAQPVEDDSDVLDGQVMVLIDGQLVHQQQKLDGLPSVFIVVSL